MIKRAGLVRGRGGVLVKLAKSIQDLRIDLPTIGLKTIEQMRESNLSALIIEAERSITLEPQELVEAANNAGIAILATRTIEDLR